MRLADLKIDDDFKNLLPELDAETYTALEKDIVANGVLDPIITWNGFIVDGHNRYSICKAHHIEEVQTKSLNKATKSDVMQWIVDHQFAKRNLSKSEQIILLAKVEEQIAKEAKERQRQAGGDKVSQKAKAVTANLPQAVETERNDTTAGQMAKKIGVSEKTYRDMKTVVTQGTPEKIRRMDKGGRGNSPSAIAKEIHEGIKDGDRKCRVCGMIKPVSEFSKGHETNVCIDCATERKRQSQQKPTVMPDTLNPDKAVEVSDEVIITKFKNILGTAVNSFRMQLKYEARMSDVIRDELINVINDHMKEINILKGEVRNETEREEVRV